MSATRLACHRLAGPFTTPTWSIRANSASAPCTPAAATSGFRAERRGASALRPRGHGRAQSRSGASRSGSPAATAHGRCPKEMPRRRGARPPTRAIRRHIPAVCRRSSLPNDAGVQAAPHPAVTGLEQVQRQLVLTGEMLVERRIRVAALLGDVANAGGSQPSRAEQLQRRPEDFLLGRWIVFADIEGSRRGHH